uniref:Uncharacterized protein n=1 Tax=Glossina brevipalpis TaxID=37001 RepID=A0A1A9WPZ9_9MUSC
MEKLKLETFENPVSLIEYESAGVRFNSLHVILTHSFPYIRYVRSLLYHPSPVTSAKACKKRQQFKFLFGADLAPTLTNAALGLMSNIPTFVFVLFIGSTIRTTMATIAPTSNAWNHVAKLVKTIKHLQWPFFNIYFNIPGVNTTNDNQEEEEEEGIQYDECYKRSKIRNIFSFSSNGLILCRQKDPFYYSSSNIANILKTISRL